MGNTWLGGREVEVFRLQSTELKPREEAGRVGWVLPPALP